MSCIDQALTVFVSTFCFVAVYLSLRFVIKYHPRPDISFAPIDWQRDWRNIHREQTHRLLRYAILLFVLGSVNLTRLWW